MVIKLNAAKRPVLLNFGIRSSKTITNSIIGTNQDIQEAKALNKGDFPSCTSKFSKSNSLLTEA